MFGNWMEKMKEARAKSDEIKARLNDTFVREVSGDNTITVIANGNREIIEISIREDLAADKERLEDELIITVNRALEKASLLYEEEMKGVLKDYLPNLPGL